MASEELKNYGGGKVGKFKRGRVKTITIPYQKILCHSKTLTV